MSTASHRISLALAVSAIALPAWAGGDPFLPMAERTAHGESGVVRLTIDFAKLVALDRPASTIVLGNNSIAAATLSDDRTLVLTGRTAGSTNLIVLDAEGEEVTNIILEVVAAGGHFITVHQGVQRQTFACPRRCEPVLSVGDDAEFFSATASQISVRNSFVGAAGQ